MVVVVFAPQLELVPRFGEREEDLHVQVFVSQLAVEALDVAFLDRPSRADEAQVHAVRVGPQVYLGSLQNLGIRAR